MKWPNFIGPTYQSQSVIASAEECINWYPEVIEVPGGKNRYALYPTPGVTPFATAAESPVRGMFGQTMGGTARAFAVIGQTLYEMASDGTLTNRGTVARDSNPATISWNGDGGSELCITTGDKLYILNLGTNVLTTELSSGAVMGVMIDGYFVALDDASSTIQISDLLDGTTWDGTQIIQRSTTSDPWKAIGVGFREVWAMGEDTSEVLYNSGASPFPFEPISGSLMHVGILAPFSLARFGNRMAWLGQSDQGIGIVYAAQGFVPQRISNHAVETAIAGYTTVTDAVAWVYTQAGHNFYVLSFPTEKVTWVFDELTNFWHKRGTWDIPSAEYKAWRPQWYINEFGKELVGDRNVGAIYELSTSVATDVNGNGIRRLRRAPGITDELRRTRLHRFQVYLESGLGLITGQGSDPTVMFRLSRDGGKTWGNERQASAGKIGEYGRRVIFRRCGAGRDLVPEIVVSDPIPWRLVDAFGKFSPQLTE